MVSSSSLNTQIDNQTIMTRKFASVLVSSLLLLFYTSHPQARPLPVDKRGKSPLLYSNEHVS